MLEAVNLLGYNINLLRMRIYSYRPEGSALAKHFQSIK